MTHPSKRDTWGSVNVMVAADAWVTCHKYPGTAPILSINSDGVSVSLSPSNRSVDRAALMFARGLFAAVGQYLAECERLAKGADDADETAIAA